MRVEMNGAFAQADTDIYVGQSVVRITPPLSEEYWLMRVPLSDTQAIVCFPKFFTIGIGFQQEEDWNTNLPYSCPAQEIFDHIKHNKGDETIADAACLAAIEMLQKAIATYQAQRT